MRPSPRFLRLLWAWLAFGLISSFWQPLVMAWAVAGAALLLLFAVDVLLVLLAEPPRIDRIIAASQPVGVWRPVLLTIENPSSHALHLRLFDHYPAAAQTEGLPLAIRVPARSRSETRYQIRFTERGEHGFPHIEALLEAPLRLALRRLLAPVAHRVRVYPNFAAVAKYALLATDHRLSQLGIRQKRRRGEGLEFHQLREYREGDALRQVDWKASSRLRKLISREYQDERDQQIFFLLDCGSRMRAKEGALSHFDEALNAMLLLAHVALRQGDAVGCLSFGHDTRSVRPGKGSATLNVLMEKLFDLHAGFNAPDYRKAATDLAKLTDKRSLVLILTNLRDEDGDELIAAVNLLRKRHLVLVASLRETAVAALLAKPAADFEAALTVAAARHYFNARSRALDRLKRLGALVLDVEPAGLPVALVNRYLEIKRSGAL
jgi:uncharacterized protein (DUF58 family)